MAINFADFAYVWPREPLVAELATLPSESDVGKRAERLFAEAFGQRALRVLAAMQSEDEVRKLVGEVLDAFHVPPTSAGIGPYFAQRSGQRLGPPLDAWTFSTILHQCVERLRTLGYFEESAPDSWKSGIEGSLQLDYVLRRRLGTRHIWTNFTGSWDDAWDEALLFSVIEVLDELISRPRLTLYSGEDRRFRDFGHETGQALFRAWVNTQLAGSSLPYRMADSGEDAGHIVAAGSSDEDKYLDAEAVTNHVAVEDAPECHRGRPS